MTDWIPAFPAAELPRGAARTLTHREDHVAVFHAEAERFLLEGTVSRTLT